VIPAGRRRTRNQRYDSGDFALAHRSFVNSWHVGHLKLGALRSQKKKDKGRSSSEAESGGGGAFVPFKAVVSSAPAFAPLCLRVGDKAADAGVLDLSLLSPPAIKAPAGATEDRRRQVVGAQAAARAVALEPSAPSLSLQSQPQQTAQQQQQARKARRTWSPELHRQFVAALNQLGGPQGERFFTRVLRFLWATFRN
jgi:hypothetical protein